MKRICVYCGAKTGARPEYLAAAEELGALMAARGLGLVYGGAHVGLMGKIADAALAGGGEVIGVLPESLMAKELAHTGLSTLHVVADLSERKQLMFDNADGFIALPGGTGTLDEVTEMLTWAQLGYHAKPLGLLNIHGYYDHLLAFLDHAMGEGFLKAEHRQLLYVADTPQGLLEQMGAEGAATTGTAKASGAR